MRINFRTVPNAKDFDPIPPGQYACELKTVEERKSAAGHPYWALQWAVSEGQFKGATVFDFMVFSAKGLPRLKLLCQVSGIDVKGMVDLKPETLLGARARVSVVTNEYQDREGKARTGNKASYFGYAPLGTGTEDDGEEPPIEGDDPGF